MIKQITGIVAGIVLVAAYATPVRADIATVGYLHEYINEKWSVNIDHNDANSNIISLRRLMQTIDRANEKLNGTATSYATTDEYNKSNIASSATAQWAVDNLIKHITGEPVTPKGTFFFTPATSENTYGFRISAEGEFTIDWGDGTIETKKKTDREEETYSHEYKLSANNYEIGLSGKATRYWSNGSNKAQISFSRSTGGAIKSMRGCLGCIFSTLEDGAQPTFSYTFSNNTELTEIPEGLFKGITGQPGTFMFNALFKGCSGLTSIPSGLFGDLSGEIPRYAFTSTFEGCTGLTGNIPEDLFDGLIAPEEYPIQAFYNTFYNCPGLTGPSAKINGKYIYEIWEEETAFSHATYRSDKQLDDYDSIPWWWK